MHLKTWVRSLKWWGLVVLIFATQGYSARVFLGAPVTIADQLRGEVLLFLPWALLTPLIFLIARRVPIRADQRARSVTLHIVAGALIAALHVVLSVTLATPFAPEPWSTRFASLLPRAFGANLLAYAALAAIAHALQWRREVEERVRAESRLQAELATLELGLLRMQLQPHFLFNTLHAISALMTKDVTRARRMMAGLSDLLRASLENEGEEQVPLSRELAYLDHYIGIQQTRFEDRLTIDVHTEPASREVLVPRLFLQPLVENAIRHGLEPRAGGGHVSIRARQSGDDLELTIDDDGRGFPADAAITEGIGLRNTRTRLHRLHGGRYTLDLMNRPEGGTRVRIRLPFLPSTLIEASHAHLDAAR